MLTIILSGRNDDYGKDFRKRLFRTSLHNAACLQRAGVEFEFLLAEWNPLPGPALSEEFVRRVPNARAVIVPPEIHQSYSLNPLMPFHEMAAKNAALRRAKGDVVIVTNADILFSEDLAERVAAGAFDGNTLYRAHRIDVNPELSWEQIQNPANQLASGEGFLPPPYYLGAGGDFCLAARSLWYSLRGFNERIRFSTRAKDWQFFLSAAARGAGIEFIGDVYHLDHEGGFRNTNSSDLNTEAVHFGRWWDIEFGLPAANSADWGFHGLRETAHGDDSRIAVLEAEDYAVSESQNRIDRGMISWLTRPPDSPDSASAVLFHAICAAQRQGRRLICRFENPQLLVALSGFDAVASQFDIPIFCDWTWSDISGYTMRAFEPEPIVPKDSDWILQERTESRGGIRVLEFGSDQVVDVLPKVRPLQEPEFNPVLSRRLLMACLKLQKDVWGRPARIAMCGMGSHTESLLKWGLPDTIELARVVDSCSLLSLSHREVDAVVLSSSSFESDMAETCRLAGIPNVLALYNDWPKDIWSIPMIGASK